MFGYIFDHCWCVVFLLLVGLYLLLNFIVDNFTISNGNGKRILITGCDSGFGYATALKLNKCNCKVFAGCLTQGGVNRLQNDKSFQGIAFIMNVTKEDHMKRAKKLIENNGGLDGLVNNAGIANIGLIEWMSIDQMKKLMDVNYWGTVRTTKEMLPFLKRSRGRVVNIASIGARLAVPYAASYCSSKFAIEAFSDCLRLEMNPWDVSVHIIEPTYHRTQMTCRENVFKSWDDIYNALPLEIKEEFSEQNFKQFAANTYNAAYFTDTNDGVINSIRHALLSYLPRRRYVPGRLGTFSIIITHLPTVVQDFIFKFLMPILLPDACKKNKKDN